MPSWQNEISNTVVCTTGKGSDQPAHTQRLVRAFTSLLNSLLAVKLPTEHHLEFQSLWEAEQARMSQHLSKCHIVGNHMSRRIIILLA